MHKPLNILICDDVYEEAATIEMFVKQSSIPTLCNIFVSSEELLSSFCPGMYDIVFMDIFMSDSALGIETARLIRKADENVMLVFTTASPDYALESYRLGVLKYLEKPITQRAVNETLELALLIRKNKETITLLVDGSKEKIPLDDVLYFEQKDHAVSIITTYGPIRTSRRVKLNDIENQLNTSEFCRCHYSYIVNLRYVQSLDSKLFVFKMKDGNHVYIRRESLKKVKDAYESYLFSMTRCEVH